MTDPAAPWQGFEEAAPHIPVPLVEWLRGLNPTQFAELLRGSLIRPTDTDKLTWAHLWQTLALAPDQARRVRRLLNDWVGLAEARLAETDDQEAKAFLRQCRHGLARLDKVGERFVDLELRDSVTGRLMRAVFEHELAMEQAGIEPRQPDVELWALARNASARSVAARRRDSIRTR